LEEKKLATGGSITSLWSMLTEIDLLEVPDFQRNYAWETQNVADLYSDLKQAKDFKRTHFVGSTILMAQPLSLSEGKKQVLVVDGQQRLTSIFMLVSLIRDSVWKLPVKVIPPKAGGNPIDVISKCHEFLFSDEENAVQRFRANTLIGKLFSDLIVAFPEKRENLPRKHHNYSLALRKAYWKLASLIEEDLKRIASDEEKLRFLYDLLKTVKDQLQILRISTDTYEESLDVFMTLNSRGLPLGPSDLIKSELFRNMAKLKKPEKLEEFNGEFAAEWKTLIDNLNDSDVDAFLRHYMISKYPGKLQGRMMPTKLKDILKTSIEDTGEELNVESLGRASRKFFDSLKYASELYGRIVKFRENEKQEGMDVLVEPLLILENSVKSHRILFMALLDSECKIDVKAKAKIARYSENLAVRWVVSGENAQDLENLFQEAALEARKVDANVDVIVTTLLKEMPKDAKCKVFFDEPITDNTFVRVLLFRLNQVNSDKSSIVVYDPEKIHVEHIAPATDTDSWLELIAPGLDGDKQKVEYEALVESWGNKTILDKHINLGVKQHQFLLKRDGFNEGPKSNFEGYKKSSLSITRDFSSIEEWSPKMINARTEWLKDAFVQCWGPTLEKFEFLPFSKWLAGKLG
jgi:hypothetical protein